MQGEAAWQQTGMIDGAWACPPCARPFVRGTPGRHPALTPPDRSASPASALPRRVDEHGRPVRTWRSALTGGPAAVAAGAGAVTLTATAGSSPWAAAGATALSLICVVGLTLTLTNRLTRPARLRPEPPGEGQERPQDATVAVVLEGAGVVALHDRAHPALARGIEHLAVGPAGVYVITTRPGASPAGQPSQRPVDTATLEGLTGQARLVSSELARVGQPCPVVPVLCDTGHTLNHLGFGGGS